MDKLIIKDLERLLKKELEIERIDRVLRTKIQEEFKIAKNWKDFILAEIAKSPGQGEAYSMSYQEAKEILDKIRNPKVVSMKVVATSSVQFVLGDFYSNNIKTPFIDFSSLEKLESWKPGEYDDTEIENRLEKKRNRLKSWKEELKRLEKNIEFEEKEIQALQTWKKGT